MRAAAGGAGDPRVSAARRRGPRGRPVALALLVLVLAGCASAPWSRPLHTPVPTAEVAEVADCRTPAVLDALGVPPDGRLTVAGTAARSATPGAAPTEFVPVEVVECSAGETLEDQAGVWTAVTERRLSGDLQPLLAQLGDASRPSADPRDCPFRLHPDPVVWLVDALGHAVIVDLPQDACGRPAPAVLRALGALDQSDRMLYPVRLLIPASTGNG